jgi:hypothetical protein
MLIGIEVAIASGFETTTIRMHKFEDQNQLFDTIRFHSYGKEGTISLV